MGADGGGMATCTGCSASNHPGSAFCWQCYRPLAAGVADPTARPAPATPATEPSPWRVKLPSAGRIIRHTAIGLLVLTVIVGVWRYLEHRQITLPDSIAGHERIENPEIEAYARAVERELGFAVKAATYARGRRAFSVIVGSELDNARPADRIRELPAIQEGVAIRKAQIRSFQSPTAFFACAPFVGVFNGTLCAWNGSGTTGAVYAISTDVPSARTLVQEVQRAVVP